MKQKALWLFVGIVLTGLFVLISQWPSDFERKTVDEAKYLLVIIGSLLAGGLVYFFALGLSRHHEASRTLFFWIIAVGLLSRLIFWNFIPPVEDDYHRYLWDGGLTAHGINPYAQAPADILQGNYSIAAEKTSQLDTLIEQARPILKQINHPHLRTLYPPIAQAVFAAAHWIAPFKLWSLRLVYLVFDLIALLFIALLLKQSGQSLLRLTIYWWNPLLIYEVYFNSHYDVIVASLLILLVWSILKQRLVTATFAMSLAIGAKLWPLILAPFLILKQTKLARYRIYTILLLIGLLGGILIPFGLAIQGEGDSGVVAYSRDWEANGWAAIALKEMGWWLVETFESDLDGRYPARALVVGILLLTATLLAWRKTFEPVQLCHSIGIVILLMLLLSPTVYPWYYVPLVGLATVAPKPMFLLWTLLLPLSYLKWLLPDSAVWLMAGFIHVPVWALLIVSGWKGWKVGRRIKGPNRV